jgi:membrane-bound acyltransferase YfiQ involved in biofilm formation
LSRIEQQSLASLYTLMVAERFSISNNQGEIAMSFGIYLVGYIILIAGLAIGANLLNVPMQWIGVAILCMVGIAIVHGVTATRQKDPQS